MTDDELIESYIEQNPYKPGLGRARLKSYGTSVAAIVRAMDIFDGDVKGQYQAPDEAIRAAMAYYRRYKDYIDARLLMREITTP